MIVFSDGDRVTHTKLDAWGPGQVINAINDQLVKVVFVNAGVKTLHLQYAALKKISGKAANNPELDRLVDELQADAAEDIPEHNDEITEKSQATKLRELDSLVPNEDDWSDDDYFD